MDTNFKPRKGTRYKVTSGFSGTRSIRATNLSKSEAQKRLKQLNQQNLKNRKAGGYSRYHNPRMSVVMGTDTERKPRKRRGSRYR